MSSATLIEELVHDLVARATHAPSSHNTQPWRFRIVEEGVAVHADRTRRLPVNDPDDRELVISVGAVVFNLRVAAAAEGIATRADYAPGPDDRLVLVRLGEGPLSGAEADLSTAIEKRWTTREPFRSADLPESLATVLAEAAAAEGARLVVVVEARDALVALVEQGARAQFADPAWRRELASWMRPPGRGDGLPVGKAAGPFARTAVRALDMGSSTAKRDGALARAAPLLAVLTTSEDDVPAWLAAGQALERVLLVAADAGIVAGYLNQPCQVPGLRLELARLVGSHPQIVLRLGPPGPRGHASSRRPVADVLVM